MPSFDEIYPNVPESFQPPADDDFEGVVYSNTRRDCVNCGEYTHWFDISWGVPLRICSPECRDALKLEYENRLHQRGC